MATRKATIVSWILYDLGMAWFSMVVLTAYFILYFKEVVVAGDKGYGDFLWGAAVSTAMAISVVLSPILGAIADVKSQKKAFFITAAGLSILSTILLYFTGHGQVFLAMVLVVTGYTGYTLAMTFYNAFLPEIAAPSSIEKLSGIGWGMGYIGGLAALICMAFIVPGVEKGKTVVLLAGILYGFFALPSFIMLKNTPFTIASPRTYTVKDGIQRFMTTFKEIRSYRTIFTFLIAYFFVSDAISTVIVFFSSYTVDTLHFTIKQNFSLLMLIQLSAAAGAMVSGPASRKLGLIRTIIITILIWIGALLGIIASSGIAAFYALSVCAGIVLGATQASARSFIALEAPPGKQAEFFGFMTFSTKVAAIFGPLLYGIISTRTHSARYAILSLELLFLAGLLIMLKVPHGRNPVRRQ